MAQPTKVFVGSLPTGTKPEELRRLFENYGIVVECDVMNRCGFVHMKNAAMAESAIEALHDTKFKGQNIVVEYGIPKERKQGGGGGQVAVRGARGGRGGGSSRGIMVGFPGIQDSNKFNQAATLQLAGVIMELLGDQQNQLDDISGGNNMRGGDSGYRRGGGGSGSQGGRGGSFQGGIRRGNQNMNGVGPIRNQGFKGDRPPPYAQVMNAGGPINANQGGSHSGGRYNSQPIRSGGANGPAGNFNNNRGGNFGPKPAMNNYGPGNSWNNDQRSGMPQQSSRNYAEDNFSGGFSGNMGNSSSGNFGGQQDRRGFALPSNQFQQYSGGSGNQMGGFGSNEGSASYGDETIFQRRTNNPPNAPIVIDFRSTKSGGNIGGSNFNRGGNPGGRGGQGGFQNRGTQHFQQGGGFKRGVPGGNMNSGDNYHQNFTPLGPNSAIAQGVFSGNNRNHGGQGGRGGGGDGMNRNAPRQNMPNRRY